MRQEEAGGQALLSLIHMLSQMADSEVAKTHVVRHMGEIKCFYANVLQCVEC